MQGEYIAIGAKDSNTGWAEEWFYIGNHPLELSPRTRRAPLPWNKWGEPPTVEEMTQVADLMKIIKGLKENSLTASIMMLNMCSHLVQLMKDSVHPAYDMTGLADLTRECTREVSYDEVRADGDVHDVAGH